MANDSTFILHADNAMPPSPPPPPSISPARRLTRRHVGLHLARRHAQRSILSPGTGGLHHVSP